MHIRSFIILILSFFLILPTACKTATGRPATEGREGREDAPAPEKVIFVRVFNDTDKILHCSIGDLRILGNEQWNILEKGRPVTLRYRAETGWIHLVGKNQMVSSRLVFGEFPSEKYNSDNPMDIRFGELDLIGVE